MEKRNVINASFRGDYMMDLHVWVIVAPQGDYMIDPRVGVHATSWHDYMLDPHV